MENVFEKVARINFHSSYYYTLGFLRLQRQVGGQVWNQFRGQRAYLEVDSPLDDHEANPEHT